jgi:TolB protein
MAAGSHDGTVRLWRGVATALATVVVGLPVLAGPAVAAEPASCTPVGASPYDSPQLSHNGSAVAFATTARLVRRDMNRTLDVYVQDRRSGSIRLVSQGLGGAAGDGRSFAPDISADGRFVAFTSEATDLVQGDDASGVPDVFLRDLATGRTELVSVARGGGAGDGASGEPAISPDGRRVAFQSQASSLVADDDNGASDVFVRDRVARSTTLVSIGPEGQPGNGPGSHAPSISDNGIVAFHSTASWVPGSDDLVRGELKNSGFYDRNVFVHDLRSRTTSLVSVAADGGTPNGLSLSPSITADGRFVAFLSSADDLVENDTNNSRDLKGFYHSDVFVRDLRQGATRRVSVDDEGDQISARSLGGSISADGSRVSFDTIDGDVDSGDPNGVFDVFVHETGDETTRRLSAVPAAADVPAPALSFGSVSSSISGDGRWAAFVSSSRALLGAQATPDDSALVFGVFVVPVDGDGGDPATAVGIGCRDLLPAGRGAPARAAPGAATPALARPAPETLPATGGGLAALPVAAVVVGGLLALVVVRRRPTHRMTAAVFVGAAGLLLASTPLPVHAHHYKPLQPGAASVSESPGGTASLNFVFRNEATGELYIGTAAHAIREVSVGGRVRNDELGEYGTLVYTREGVFDFSKQDFALIRVDADKRDLVDPGLRYWGGPTGVVTVESAVSGLPTFQYGQASYMRHADAARAKQGVFQGVLDNDVGLVGWYLEARHAYGGDSGSPLVYGPDGRGLGIVSGFAILFSEPGVNAGPTLQLILQELQLAGFEAELVTAPFHGVAGDVAGRAAHCAAAPVEDGPENDGCVRPRSDG